MQTGSGVKILIWNKGKKQYSEKGLDFRDESMTESIWLFCPVCKNKTREKIRKDTVLINFPLYCHKCKLETIINVQNQIVTVKKKINPTVRLQHE